MSTANAGEPVATLAAAVTAKPAAQKPLAARLDVAPVNKPAADKPAAPSVSAHETILGGSIDLRAHKKPQMKPKTKNKRKPANKVDAAHAATPGNEEKAPTLRIKASKKAKKVPNSALGEYVVKNTDEIACDQCKVAIVSEGYYSRGWLTAHGCLDSKDCGYDLCSSCYLLLK